MKKNIHRVVVTIVMDVENATEDQLHEIATDMYSQRETLEDEHDAEVLWSDYVVEIEKLED